MMVKSPDKTDAGFLDFTLAYFDPKDFQVSLTPAKYRKYF